MTRRQDSRQWRRIDGGGGGGYFGSLSAGGCFQVLVRCARLLYLARARRCEYFAKLFARRQRPAYSSAETASQTLYTVRGEWLQVCRLGGMKRRLSEYGEDNSG